MTNQTQFYAEPVDRQRVMEMERASRRRMLPETAGYSETPPVLHREPYTPSLRRFDWAEVAFWIVFAGLMFAAGWMVGGGRVGL